MKFQDKVVVITGASSGIGAGTAVAFAKEGAKLVLGGRNEENLQKTAKACEEQGVKAENIAMVLGELTKEEHCNAIVEKAVDTFGHLDVLVNNAGGLVMGATDKATIEDVDYMFDNNVRSVFMVTKCAVPHLKETKGCIVNVSSVSAMRPSRAVAYGMAKAALNHFSQSLAQDLGPSGVRVNCVIPGFINTPIFSRPGGSLEDQPEKVPQMLKEKGNRHALRRTGEVEEVAEVILFLSSDAASFMTGALVPADGGYIGRNVF